MNMRKLLPAKKTDTFENGVIEGEYVWEYFFSWDPENESYMNEWFDYTYVECNPTPEFKKGFMSAVRKYCK
jgi:hypothetical protein